MTVFRPGVSLPRVPSTQRRSGKTWVLQCGRLRWPLGWLWLAAGWLGLAVFGFIRLWLWLGLAILGTLWTTR